MAVVGRNPGLIEYVCLMPPTSDSSFPALLIVFFAPLAPVAVDWKMDCYGRRREKGEKKFAFLFHFHCRCQQTTNCQCIIICSHKNALWFILPLPPPSPPRMGSGRGFGWTFVWKIETSLQCIYHTKKKNANHPSSHHVDCWRRNQWNFLKGFFFFFWLLLLVLHCRPAWCNMGKPTVHSDSPVTHCTTVENINWKNESSFTIARCYLYMLNGKLHNSSSIFHRTVLYYLPFPRNFGLCNFPIIHRRLRLLWRTIDASKTFTLRTSRASSGEFSQHFQHALIEFYHFYSALLERFFSWAWADSPDPFRLTFPWFIHARLDEIIPALYLASALKTTWIPCVKRKRRTERQEWEGN